MRYISCAMICCPRGSSKSHRFPNPKSDSHQRYWKWVLLTGNRDILSMPPLEVYRLKRICSRHFSDSCYYISHDGKTERKLLKTALPDLYLPKPLMVSIPEQNLARGAENLVIKLEEDSVPGTNTGTVEAVGNAEFPGTSTSQTLPNLDQIETVEMMVLKAGVEDACAKATGSKEGGEQDASQIYRFLTLVTDPVGTCHPIRVLNANKHVIDVPKSSSGMIAEDLKEEQDDITTGELIGVENQPPNDSTEPVASFYSSSFGNIPKEAATDCTLSKSVPPTSADGSPHIASSSESVPSTSACDPLNINIVIPSVSGNVKSSFSSVPSRVIGEDSSGLKSLSNDPNRARALSSASKIFVISGRSADSRVSGVNTQSSDVTLLERVPGNLNFASARKEVSIGAPVTSSGSGDDLFSIPGSVFDPAARGSQPSEVKENDPPETTNVPEMVDLGVNDDDSSCENASVFSQESPARSPVHEETTLDGMTMEQLAQSFFAGCGRESIVFVSDPYYRYKLCRLCFKAGKDMTCIFGETFKEFDLKDAIEDLVRFRVSKVDDYPQQICELCLPKLTKFKRFKDRFLVEKESFDEELRKHNKTVDEGGDCLSNKTKTQDDCKAKSVPDLSEQSDHQYTLGSEEGEPDSNPVGAFTDDDIPNTSKWKLSARKDLPSGNEGETTDPETGLREGYDDDFPMESSSEGEDDHDETSDIPVLGTPEMPIYRVDTKKAKDDGLFHCNFCEETFQYVNLRNAHQKEHEKTFPFPCTDCDRRFQSLFQLNYHVVSHSDYRPYECDICGKRFRRTGDLRAHKVLHLGQRNYLCSDCGKSYSGYSSYLRHMQTHSDRKRYLCNICQREFAKSVSLKRHLESHQEECTVTCEVCGKGFRSKTYLRHHMSRLHAPTGHFPCDICSKVFPRKKGMLEHRRYHFYKRAPRIRKAVYLNKIL